MSLVSPANKAIRGRRPYAARLPAEQRREQLMDAALQLIVEGGYEALSIDAIAKRAGVTRPVVYNVFDGIDELLQALLDRQEARALDQLLTRISLEPDLAHLDGFVRRTIDALIAMVTGDPLTWRPILLAFAATPAVVRERIDRDRELVRQRFEAVIRLALSAAPTEPRIDPNVLSHALVALGEYFGRAILESPGTIDAEALASTVGTLIAGAMH